MKKYLFLIISIVLFFACEDKQEKDCAGVEGGTAMLDCFGVCDGIAAVDNCEQCVGGTTGEVACTQDCADIWGGNNICGCTDTTAINYNPEATTNDGSCYHDVVTDIDGNEYQAVQIGEQLWMKENLKVTHYNNGDEIPTGYNNSEWENLSTGAYAIYNDDLSNAEIYNNLYNWYAVDDSRNIAPEGWHVPDDDDFKQLEIYLGMSQAEADTFGYRGTNEGGKLKESGHEHWEYYSDETTEGATNESGFTALPGSYRHPGGGYYSIGSSGYFWSSTGLGSGDIAAYARKLFYEGSGIYMAGHMINSGYSVRCVKD